MSKSNTSKIAVINGAYGGIGKAIALKLSNDGYTLALMGRNIKKLESLRKEINNGDIKIYAADTKEHDQIDRACIKILENFDRIDVLVNAVGIVPIGSLSEINQKVWKNAIQTCLLGQIHLVTSFSKSMRTAKSGSIILINGVLSIQPDPNFVVSSTLAGAINNFAKAISKDLGDK